MAKTAWITGASSGLGLHTAMAVSKAGFQVVAGARSFGEGKKTVAGMKCLPLDVTDPNSVDQFVHSAIAAYGPPDVLINCAGVLILGACEGYALEEIRQVMETNFLGQAAMIQRALPLMREKGGGRIVNFSSINGLLGIPFQGAYVASKHAVEGFSECLAMECKPYGVQVMLVEPGDHQSGAQAYRRVSQGVGEASPYREAFERARAVIAHDESTGSDPDALGRKVVRAIQKRHMPRRLRVAKLDQHFAVLLHDLLPTGLFERIIASYYRKKLKE